MKKKTDLIIINNEPRVDSRLISKGMEIEHKATIQLINQYKNELEQLGILPFEMDKKRKRGRPEKYVLLNEDQSIFLW